MPVILFAPLTIDKIKDNHNNLKDRVLILETDSKNFKEHFNHSKITTDVGDIQSAKRTFIWSVSIAIPVVLVLVGVILKYTYFVLEAKVTKLETNIVEMQKNNNCKNNPPTQPLPEQSSSSAAS